MWEIPAGWGRCVVTIGVFDGVHRGHAQLIATAIEAGRRRGLPVVVMTFDPHPMEVVRPGSHPPQLSTLPRRAELVEELGVDAFCVLPFTPVMAAQPPAEFVLEVLVERLHAAEVVVGDNFTFGHRALGTVDTLEELGATFGFEARGVSLVGEMKPAESTGTSEMKPAESTRIRERAVTFSSTYIRSCVAAGDMRAAAEALGRPHRVEGVVVRGDGRGRDLGYPTANVAPPMYTAIPADGVYAAWFSVLGGTRPGVGHELTPIKRYPAAVSVGTNPTFSGRTRTVEAHLLDESADLYGRHVAVDFVERLRPMVAFSSIDELVAAIDDDVVRTREVLGVSPEAGPR